MRSPPGPSNTGRADRSAAPGSSGPRPGGETRCCRLAPRACSSRERRATPGRRWTAASPAPLPCRRGFTLVEALVALAILALFAVFAWRATAAMADGESRLAGESARWEAIAAAVARLEADMRAAVPRPVRTSAGREASWRSAREAGGNASLAFTRAGIDASDPLGAGARVGYRVRDGALELLYWATLDRADDAPAAVYRLFDGVDRLTFRHQGATGDWLDEWPPAGRDDLPRAVVVRIALADGGEIERWIVLR
ncbi:MAG: type II secretion system minor pseudopilin GspJ [Burkholderiales bacterium]